MSKPPRAKHNGKHNKKQAVIDLGSNTIRLAVYDVALTSQHKGSKHAGAVEGFKILLNEKRVAGLSSYVEKDVLSPAGIEKAADVLERHITLAKNIECNDISLFATAVIRNLNNRAEVVRALERACGRPVHVLSGEEEAHLGFVGATHATSLKNGLLIDIGGGSTELTVARDGADVFSVSLDQGCVSSYAQFVRCLFPTEKEQKAMRSAFEARLETCDKLPRKIDGNLYCIGGSARAIAKFYARMHESDKAAKAITLEQVEEILALAKTDKASFAHLATKAVPDRLHTLVPGCIIVKTLMKRFRRTALTIGKYGVREGYLLSLYS